MSDEPNQIFHPIIDISQPGDNTDTSGGFERLRIRNDNDPQEVRKRL